MEAVGLSEWGPGHLRKCPAVTGLWRHRGPQGSGPPSCQTQSLQSQTRYLGSLEPKALCWKVSVFLL